MAFVVESLLSEGRYVCIFFGIFIVGWKGGLLLILDRL